MPSIQEIRQKYPQYGDLSDQQLADSLHTKYYSDMPKDQFYGKVGLNVQPQGETPEKLGFFGRVEQDLQKRKGMIQDAATAYNAGKQSLPETYAQGILNGGAGFGSDLIGNAIGSVARTVDDATLGVAGKSLNRVLGAVANSPVGVLAKQGMDKYDKFAKDNPRAARNIQAAGNAIGLATAFTPVKGVSAVGAAEKAIAPSAKALGNDVTVALNQRGINKYVRENSPGNVQDLEKLGTQKYKTAEEIGGTLNPRGVELLSDKAREIGVQSSMDKRLGYAPDAVDDIAERLQNLRGSTISLQELDQLDTRLRTIKNKNYISGDTDVARKAEELQDFLREFRDGADPSLIDGGQEGFAAWRAGDEIWTQKHKLQQIEDILAVTENKPNKAQAIRTRAQTLLANKKKTGHWTPQEKEALRQMGKSGIADGVLGLLGGRLAAAVGLGAGNPVGALALHGVGIASRGGRDALQVGRAEKAAQTILRKVSPPRAQLEAEFLAQKGKISVAPVESKSKIRLLPAPERPYVSGPSGTRKMTDYELEAANAGRARARDMGMDPGTGRAIQSRKLMELRAKNDAAFSDFESQFNKIKSQQENVSYANKTKQMIGENARDRNILRSMGVDIKDTDMTKALIAALRGKR